MKWRNHKIVTFGAVFSMTGGFIAAASAAIGSLLPDVLELGGLVQHRTATHYIWFWVPASVVLWLMLRSTGFSVFWLYVLFFVVSGGLLHVLQDALSNGGIPWVTPYGSRQGLGVYRTDTFSEEITVLGLLVVFGGLSWFRGFLAPDYLSSQLEVVMRVFARVARLV